MNLTVSCKIQWTESVYEPYVEGKESAFIGERTITGRITTEGYSKRNYHFFTIHVYTSTGTKADDVLPNSKITRRGVVIYPKCSIISKPPNYQELVDEKKKRKQEYLEQKFGDK